MAQEFVIEIAPNGDVTVAGKGISGPDCVKMSAAIEEALGTVTKRTKTAEYSQQRQILRKANA